MRVSIKNGQLVVPLSRRLRWKLNCAYWTFTVWSIDRLPWFARKRLFNWIFEIDFHDFQQTDRVISGSILKHPICVKW